MSIQKTHITLTGEDTSIQAFAQRLNHRGLGVETHLLPTVSFSMCNLTAEDIAVIHKLQSFDYLFFSSARAVHYFKQLLDTEGVSSDICPPAAVVGPMTARACAEAGILVAHQPHTYTAAHMVRELGDLSNKKILFPRSTIAPEDTITSIKKAGADVRRLSLYQTVSRSNALTEQEQEGLMRSTYILFMSPSSIRSFVKLLDEATLKQVYNTLYALCIGPRTLEIARTSGWQSRAIVATPHTSEGLLETLSTLTR